MSLPSLIGDAVSCEQFVGTVTPQKLLNINDAIENVTGVLIQASLTNAGTIYLGDAQKQFWEMQAGDVLALDISRATLVFAKTDEANEGDKLALLIIRATQMPEQQTVKVQVETTAPKPTVEETRRADTGLPALPKAAERRVTGNESNRLFDKDPRYNDEFDRY